MIAGCRQLASVVTALAVMLSTGVTCTGWKPTPEARRACCNSGGECDRSEDRAGTRAVTQAEADGCCAASESDTSDSAPSPMSAAASPAPGVAVTFTASLAAAPPAVVSERWRAAVPRPPRVIPTHLLLSVLLV